MTYEGIVLIDFIPSAYNAARWPNTLPSVNDNEAISMILNCAGGP